MGAAAAAAVATLLLGGRLSAQPEEVSRAELLRHDIRLLEMLRSLDFTAEQRRDAAKLVAAFDEQRRAAEKRRDADALVQALTTVRESLLKGQPPTAAMRQAVQAATPPDDESAGRALEAARVTVLDGLAKLLTDDQRTQLQVMPLVEFANELLRASLDAQELPAAEWTEWRRQSFGEMRDALRRSAGPKADQALAGFQGLIDRLHQTPPEEMRLQWDKLTHSTVSLLRDALLSSPEAVEQMLRDQLWQWLADPRMLVVLQESAKTMAGE